MEGRDGERRMTSEARAALREKVARAIAKTQDDDWENPALFLADANDTAESGREAYRDMADAAIDMVLEEARGWQNMKVLLMSMDRMASPPPSGG
jgi:hypothetical protein